MAYLGKVPALVPIDATDIPANSIDASKLLTEVLKLLILPQVLLR